jgi:hypothetical protein
MSTPNRQIGWSQESNLLSYISKQLDKLNGTVAATAAGGLLNPTTDRIPYNSGLAFGDSFLVNDATNSVLKTVYSASDVGLKLDFANTEYYIGETNLWNNHYGYGQKGDTIRIGDVGAFLSNIVFEINNDTGNYIKTSYGGNDIGLKLDFANNIYILGDNDDIVTGSVINIGNSAGNSRITITANNIGTPTSYEIDGSNSIIKSVYQGNDIGLKLDFANNRFEINGGTNKGFLQIECNNDETYLFNSFVDIGSGLPGSANGTTLSVWDFSSLIKSSYGGNDIGLKLDFANNEYRFGDYTNVGGSASNLLILGSEVAVETVLYGISGFKADGTLASAWLGDFNGNANNTFLILDDVLQRLELSGNLEASTAGASSGKFLKITIGGVDYKIALLNN